MKDRKGVELAVGDRVFVLPSEMDRDGGTGYVRRLKSGKARVDDGPADMSPEIAPGGPWTWSAWVKPEDVEKI